MKTSIIDKFILKLNGRISNRDLKIVYDSACIFFDDYDVSLKETLPAVIDDSLYLELDAFCISLKLEGKSDNTIKQYRRTNKMLLDYIQKHPIDISTNDIRKYLIEYQRVRNVKDTTLKSQMTYLKVFYSWLVNNDYILKNPFNPIKTIKTTKTEKKALSDVELEKVRQSCKDIRESVIVETLYSTGCRVHELCTIKLSDIDFERKEIKILGKGKKENTVYLNAKSALVINQYLNERPGNSEYLLCSCRYPYKRLSERMVERIIANIGESAHLNDRLYPHKMRRTMATVAFNRGMSIASVSKLLNHKNLDTTMTYTNISRDDLKLNHAKYIV